MPEISVIIPCYNAENYIDRCLTSVVSQDIGLDSLQIICVDDASTDSTWQHLLQWEQKYPDNFICVQLEHNSRQGAARNMGMQYVNTTYVSFIDADDWIDLDYYSTLFYYATEFNCEIVCCQYVRDPSIEPITHNERGTGEQSHIIFIESVAQRKTFLCQRNMGYGSCGKLIKTDFLSKNNIYFPDYLAYEDNIWSSLIHLYAQRIGVIEEKMYHYFVNPHSTIMKKDAEHHADYITVYLQLWKEWNNRGFLDVYREELEYDYLYSFYISFLRITFIRYETPPYSLFQLLRQIVAERIPDYRTNPYIEKYFDDFHKLLLEPLLTPINREEYLSLATYVQLYWAVEDSQRIMS